MKNLKPIIVLVICLNTLIAFAQNVPSPISYPDTLWSNTDTFYVQFSYSDSPYTFTTTVSDTIDLGTHGFEDIEMTVWTDSDTLTVSYVNAPLEQILHVPIGSVADTAIFQLRFNSSGTIFSKSYITNNKNTSSFSIPETYELANIILSLSDCSLLTENRKTNSDYARKVEAYFSPFKSHPLIQNLNNKCANDGHWETYYGFRENSICYSFNDNNFLVRNTPYKHVWSDYSKIDGGEFRSTLYLVQDFVKKSNFNAFYSQNIKYYNELEARQKQLMPVKKMWSWLEKEFPQRYDAYKIIFSPLIVGSHATRKFQQGDLFNPDYKECVMFVNAPDNLNSKNEYAEKLSEGFQSGVVFTEIDHNYVNPASKENILAIKELISDFDFWSTIEARRNYNNEFTIFNEYFTHSLFCLYTKENYKGDIQKEVISKRIKLMEKRGFKKFKAFNDILLTAMQNRKTTIYEAFPDIIKEMEVIKRH